MKKVLFLSLVLCHGPWQISQGVSLRQRNQALPKLLEPDTVHMQKSPDATACIINAMGIVQGLKQIPETFGELAEHLLD